MEHEGEMVFNLSMSLVYDADRFFLVSGGPHDFLDTQLYTPAMENVSSPGQRALVTSRLDSCITCI